MSLTFTWINLLILFGAVQALVFSVVLLFQKRHPGTGFLSVLAFIIAYNGFETFNWSAGLDRYFYFFDLFSFITIFGIGPSLYLYAHSVLHPETVLSTPRVLAHYGILIFQFVTRIALITYHLLWINKIITSSVSPSHLANFISVYAEPTSVLLFLLYYVATLKLVWRYKSSTKSQTKEKQIAFNWVRALLIAMGILAVAWPVTILLPNVTDIAFGDHYYPVELVLVIFSYWLVFYGYQMVKVISRKSVPTAEPSEESKQQLETLRKAMEEDRYFLDPEISLAKLAKLTGIPVKTVSQLLNQYNQSSFNDFINQYRIREVQRRLADSTNKHLTISGIAMECGFNSQATFQRVFKSTTGLSPREYIKQQLQKTA